MKIDDFRAWRVVVSLIAVSAVFSGLAILFVKFAIWASYQTCFVMIVSGAIILFLVFGPWYDEKYTKCAGCSDSE